MCTAAQSLRQAPVLSDGSWPEACVPELVSLCLSSAESLLQQAPPALLSLQQAGELSLVLHYIHASCWLAFTTNTCAFHTSGEMHQSAYGIRYTFAFGTAEYHKRSRMSKR